MRTKTLLIAAVALAAGILTSSAQTYSQNIVGYVNQPFAGGKYVQIVVPLETTPTNAPEDVFPALQTGDAILLWTNGQYVTYTYFAPQTWLYPDNVTFGLAPNLPAGTGLFYLAAGNETNTYVGTVVLSNTNAPITLLGGKYALVGSLPPIAASSLEDTNLNLPLAVGDAALIWTNQQYSTYTFFGPGTWLYPDNVTFGVSPALQVGQGFFYLPAGNEIWTQNLIVQ
jgi:hypothetical protein